MTRNKMILPDCVIEMNHHANKVDYSSVADVDSDELTFGGVLQEAHSCPNCGRTELREAYL